jgi:hypothetical protein
MEATTTEKPQSNVVVPDTPYSKRDDTAPLPAVQPNNLMTALAVAAADPRMDVAKVERLFAMHKELQDREAAQAFADAMAKAQANIRPIAKDRRNDHTKSWYATLAAIVDEATPVVTAEGLSVSYDTYEPSGRDKDMEKPIESWHRVIALVSHRGGHVRKYHLDGPLDDAGKTGIQAMGSTVSYLRRYLFCMIFNVATADDNDGNGGGNGAKGEKLAEKKVADHCAKMDEATNEADLMRIFSVAWNEAEEIKDKDAQRVFMTKRDERRRAIKARRS